MSHRPPHPINPTRKYTPGYGVGGIGIAHVIDNKPWFSYWDVARLQRDPFVNFLRQVWCGPLQQVKFKIKASSPEVAKTVDRATRFFWRKGVPTVMRRYFLWGYAPAGIEYEAKRGSWSINKVTVVQPRDARVRIHTKEPWKGEFAGFETPSTGHVLCPYAFWFCGSGEFGDFYDLPPAAALWDAWTEYGSRGGARSIRQLYMRKHSISPAVLRYPEGMSKWTDDGGNVHEIDNKLIALQILEMYEAGANVVLPSGGYENGNPKWELTPAEARADAESVSAYPRVLKEEMAEAIGMPFEVIKAAETGSGYSGRSVPYKAWLGNLDEYAGMLADQFDRMVLRYLVQVNHGPKADYEIEPISLVEQMEQQASASPGGTPPPGPDQQPNGPQTGPDQPTPDDDITPELAHKMAADQILELHERGMREGDTKKYRHAMNYVANLAGNPDAMRKIVGHNPPWPGMVYDPNDHHYHKPKGHHRPFHMGHGDLGYFDMGWVSETGPRGGKRWKNTETGRIVYQQQQPGQQQPGQQQPGQPEQPTNTSAAPSQPRTVQDRLKAPDSYSDWRDARAQQKRDVSAFVANTNWGEKPTENLKQLIDHLPSMTGNQLRETRRALAASFGGNRRVAEMRQALHTHVMSVLGDIDKGEQTAAAAEPDARPAAELPIAKPVEPQQAPQEQPKPAEPQAAAKEPWQMTRVDHDNLVGSQQGNSLSQTNTIDWGNLRGQGKRTGGGMVVGGMRDSSLQGKRSYTDIVGKLPKEEYDEAKLLEKHEQLTYARAREAGFSHHHAMGLAYEHTTDYNAHRDAVASALAAGKPVPPEVLADYPDLAAKQQQAPQATEQPKPAEPAENPGQGEAKKEPWEMTADEYIDHLNQERSVKQIGPTGKWYTRAPLNPAEIESAKREHHRILVDAINDSRKRDKVPQSEIERDARLKREMDAVTKQKPVHVPVPVEDKPVQSGDYVDHREQRRLRMQKQDDAEKGIIDHEYFAKHPEHKPEWMQTDMGRILETYKYDADKNALLEYQIAKDKATDAAKASARAPRTIRGEKEKAALQLFEAAELLNPNNPNANAEIINNHRMAGARKAHARDVESALSQGKPVPPEVLADYPDLAAKQQQAPQTPAQPQPTEPATEPKAEPVEEPSDIGVWGIGSDKYVQEEKAKGNTASDAELRQQHAESVKSAIMRGEVIPLRVLQEYPSIVASYANHIVLPEKPTVATKVVDQTAENEHGETLQSLREQQKQLQGKRNAEEDAYLRDMQAKKRKARTREQQYAIDEEWRQGKDRIAQKYIPEMRELGKRVAEHPITVAERQAANEGSLVRLHDQIAADIEKHKQYDNAMWETIQQQGGVEAVKTNLQQTLSRLERNRARLKVPLKISSNESQQQSLRKQIATLDRLQQQNAAAEEDSIGGWDDDVFGEPKPAEPADNPGQSAEAMMDQEGVKEEGAGNVDARIAASKKREAETPKATQTNPIPANTLDAVRDELRAVIPGVRVVGAKTKSGHVQIYPPSTQPFTVEQGNAVRAVLRQYGIVDGIDGTHMENVNHHQSVIGNLVMDSNGPHEKYRGENGSNLKPDWKKTFDEYAATHSDAAAIADSQKSQGKGQIAAIKRVGRIADSHRAAVAAALAAGKPVPPEVLADYPDLAAKQQQAPQATEQPKPAEPADNPGQSEPTWAEHKKQSQLQREKAYADHKAKLDALIEQGKSEFVEKVREHLKANGHGPAAKRVQGTSHGGVIIPGRVTKEQAAALEAARQAVLPSLQHYAEQHRELLKNHPKMPGDTDPTQARTMPEVGTPERKLLERDAVKGDAEAVADLHRAKLEDMYHGSPENSPERAMAYYALKDGNTGPQTTNFAISAAREAIAKHHPLKLAPDHLVQKLLADPTQDARELVTTHALDDAKTAALHSAKRLDFEDYHMNTDEDEQGQDVADAAAATRQKFIERINAAKTPDEVMALQDELYTHRQKANENRKQWVQNRDAREQRQREEAAERTRNATAPVLQQHASTIDSMRAKIAGMKLPASKKEALEDSIGGWESDLKELQSGKDSNGDAIDPETIRIDAERLGKRLKDLDKNIESAGQHHGKVLAHAADADAMGWQDGHFNKATNRNETQKTPALISGPYAISEDGTLSHTQTGLKMHSAGSVEEAKALAKILHDAGHTATLENFSSASVQDKRNIMNTIKDFAAGNIPEPKTVIPTIK
jgi:hypothetical protein